jgi:hypothetical protein
MTALEKISAAEDKVSELQDALEVVGNVLDTTEQIVIEGKKAGRCLRRLLKVLVLISIVAALAMIVKKVVAGRCSAEEAAELETVVEEADVEAAIEEIEEAEVE